MWDVTFHPLKELRVPAGTLVRSLALIPSVTAQRNRTTMLSALAVVTPSSSAPHGFKMHHGYEVGNISRATTLSKTQRCRRTLPPCVSHYNNRLNHFARSKAPNSIIQSLQLIRLGKSV
ncbi:hypothetical protein QVD17_27149 [Tagetes erecta]|uniref:Uncharacterized protein n=1 Tax=Tagetes erecta TaxID=13708 RepID=A0AAD8KAD7_TARER|nr:hypothetical protein QVD17_27149 [Tagetes erecta]